MAEFTDRLAQQIANADTYLWRGLTQLDDTVPGIGGATGGKVDNLFARQFKQLVLDVAAIKARPAVEVDARALAAELTGDVGFVNALAAAIVGLLPSTDDIAAELGSRLSTRPLGG